MTCGTKKQQWNQYLTFCFVAREGSPKRGTEKDCSEQSQDACLVGIHGTSLKQGRMGTLPVLPMLRTFLFTKCLLTPSSPRALPQSPSDYLASTDSTALPSWPPADSPALPYSIQHLKWHQLLHVYSGHCDEARRFLSGNSALNT